MGCSNSTRKPSRDTLPTYEKGLTISEEEKALLRKTWKQFSYDMPATGVKVFSTLFNNHPHIKQLFPCRDVVGEALLEDPNFKGHALRFMQAIGAAVDNIDNLQETMVPLLVSLGKEHIHYKGLSIEYFDAFTDAILQVCEADLKDDYSLEVSFIWREVVEFMIDKLKEGYREAMKKQANQYQAFVGSHKRVD